MNLFILRLGGFKMGLFINLLFITPINTTSFIESLSISKVLTESDSSESSRDIFYFKDRIIIKNQDLKIIMCMFPNQIGDLEPNPF